MAAIAPPGGAFLPAFQPISEDSCILKSLASIPFVGVIPRLFANNSLAAKLSGNLDPAKQIELIRVKNDYKTAAIVSSMIVTAMLIVGMAAGVIGGVLGLSLGILAVVLNGFSNLAHTNDMQQNNIIMRELVLTGETHRQIR